jgi:cation diffusion facilitator CzcD-associated flavoprotein CzcO
MHLHSTDQKVSREYVARDMRQKLGDDPILTKHLIPDYALGCRRMTPGPDYLQSLRRDNVHVITTSATRFTSDGIIDDSGKETKVDVIICATGFHTSGPSYDIIGRDGRSLGEHWAENPKGYMSFMADGFPNMFRKFSVSVPIRHQASIHVSCLKV